MADRGNRVKMWKNKKEKNGKVDPTKKNGRNPEMSEKVISSELVEKKKEIIPGLAKKFLISEEKAENFLKLAIEDCARSKYRLNIIEDTISGPPDKIKEMKKEIEKWSDDEFDQEDFEIIGYCKNI